MSIFDEINRTIAMRPDTSDELAILAKDARGLSKDERQLINDAAQELRDCYRYISRMQCDLHEAHAQGIAAREQISELRAKIDVKPAPKPPTVTWTTLLSGPVLVSGPIYGKRLGS